MYVHRFPFSLLFHKLTVNCVLELSLQTKLNYTEVRKHWTNLGRNFIKSSAHAYLIIIIQVYYDNNVVLLFLYFNVI